MKTKLQIALASIAPQVWIRTLWEHDPDHQDIRKDCEGMDGENPHDWQAWASEVRASACTRGELKNGSAYLGGTWEKAEDIPAESNPDISGYEIQMTIEALAELCRKLGDFDPPLLEQIAAAARYCTEEAKRAYDKQRAIA
jgi:hypothetical protein